MISRLPIFLAGSRQGGQEWCATCANGNTIVTVSDTLGDPMTYALQCGHSDCRKTADS